MPPMPVQLHVGLNALFLDPGISGGPETYLRGLVPVMAARHPQTRFTVFTTRRGASALRKEGWEQWCSVVSFSCDDGQRWRRTVAEQVLLPRGAGHRRCDLIHSLGSVAPLRPGRPAVITFHDVTFMHVATFGRLTTFGMTQLSKRPALEADALIAISAAARDDIVATLGLDPDRFTVIPHGPGRKPGPLVADVDSLRDRLGLSRDGRVVACVGAKRPHKNQALLIRALPHLDGDVVLVLAGHAEPYEAELRELVDRLGLAQRVRFVGYVPDPELEALYVLSACLAFPTLGEGFGLPVLEAMQRGVAVACSDLPVLREVAGDAAVFFQPDDPVGAARAIQGAMSDPSLPLAGRERAAAFSWDAAADATHAVYESVIAAQRQERRGSGLGRIVA